MKSFFFWSGILMIVIAGIMGCTMNKDTPANPPPLTSPPAAGAGGSPTVTEDHPATASVCPVPPLVIDTNMQKTVVQYGFSFGDNNRSYTLTAGSIIYHGPDGITRVFDRNGTQLLAADDSASMMPTPGGLLPSTKVLEVPSGALVQADGNMTHIILNGTCIGTTIVSDILPVPSGSICHCPMEPARSITITPTATPDDGLCHCP